MALVAVPANEGLLPFQAAEAGKLVRITGLKHVRDASKAGLALTVFLGAPCPIRPEHTRFGRTYVSVPLPKFDELFGPCRQMGRPYRREYKDEVKGCVIVLEGCHPENGKNIYRYLSSPNQTRNKRKADNGH